MKIGVIGAGSWGTALACMAVQAGHDTIIWARSEEIATTINQTHANPVYLPGIALPKVLRATTKRQDLAQSNAVLIATPAQAMRIIMSGFNTILPANIPGIICAKGIEQSSDKFMIDVLQDVCPSLIPAILSGPSFAADVAHGLPTAVVLATSELALAKELAQNFNLPTFRIYASDDLIGVQLGGAVKNVLALACGMAEGKKLGDSARAALTTRGFAELCRLGDTLGGRAVTLAGLSGLGDLILTCSSMQSRNFSLGCALGQGQKIENIMAGRRMVSEGVHSASVVVDIARQQNIDMPIAEAVHAVVSGTSDLDSIIAQLLARPVKAE